MPAQRAQVGFQAIGNGLLRILPDDFTGVKGTISIIGISRFGRVNPGCW